MKFQVFLLKNSKRRLITYLTMITFCVIIISILFASISNASQSPKRCDLNKKYLWCLLGSVRSDVLECPRSSCDDYEEEAAKILISHLLTKESGKGLSGFIFIESIKHIILSSLLDELYSYAVTIGEIELKKVIEKIEDMLNKEPEEQIEEVEFPLRWRDIGGTITCFPLEKEGPYSRQIGEALIIFRSPHSLTVKEIVEEIEGGGYLYVPPANLRSKKEELKKYHLNEKVRPFTLVMIGTIYEVGSVIITQDWRKTIGGPIVNFFQTSELPIVAPVITSPLKITPAPPYYYGDIISAEFTIANIGMLPIKFSVLTVGGRDNDNQVADFSHRQNIILKPIESYDYKGTLILNKVGNYHFFCTYQTPDGEWNTNIDVGSKLTDEDREEDIYVEEKIVNQPPDPPANLAQFESDGEAKISIRGKTDGHNIILKGKVKDPDGDKARLEVEIRRLNEYGGQFDEDAGGLKQSDLFENNSEIMLPVNELADGDYHWRARAIDEHDLASEWVSFGGNPDSAVDFTVGQEAVTPVIASPLKITTDSPYYVGDTINAEFTITNQSSLPIKFSVLTVGGRDPDNHVSDFTHRQNITLEASKSYDYQGTLALNKVGNYHFFCTYQTPDGEWNTNVDLGSGLTDEDRIKEIVVIEREAEKEVVYVAEQSNERIQKFTSEGKFITKWGKRGSGDSDFILPRGIAIDSQGNVYVADANNCCIQKFTSEGKFITKWGKRGSGDSDFDCPIGIAIDSQDNIYVADSYNERIQKFTSEGKFITKWWGKEGKGYGEFGCPQGIAIDSQDNIYVADSYNERIQKFTSEGKFITDWGKEGSGDGEFNEPQGIAIDSQDNIYVADSYNERIQKFTSEGKFITKWGKEGSGDGEFNKPQGIAIDSQDNIYITDWNNHRIQKFTSEGKFITKWGKEGSGDGEFDYPTGIAISRIYETGELEEKEEEKPSIAPDISEELYMEWDKTFGGSEDDRAFSILQTADGGYTVAGWTNSKGAGKYDIWIIKLDQGGNMLWDKTFGGSEDDWAFSILQTADGGYIVAGWTNSKGAGKRDAWVIKLDQGGNMLWDKTFGGSEDDRAFSILQTADGGYILTGATESKGAGKRDIWVIKLDQGGNMLWDKTFGGSEYDRANVILQTADGGYAVAGWTNSKGAGEVDAWVIKLDQGGNMLWDKTFGGSEDDAVGPIIQTADGGYILTGETNSKGAGKYDIWVIKLDQGGNMLWDKTFGGSEDDTVGPIIQTADGGYILTGATESKGAGKRDAWVIKLDQGGNMLWDKTFGGSEDDAVGPIIQTADGGYIVAGWTISKGAGEMDTWVIKLSTKSIEETFEEEVNAMEALEDKIEKEKILIDSSLYHIECNKPIVSGNIFVVIPVNVSGPADELALILANPEGETDIRFISKRALIDNFETVKLHMGNAPLSEGPYILTVKTVTPENVIYKKELWFTPPDVSIVDAEFTYKITHLGGAYGHAGYYFLEIVSLTLINNGDLPAKRDTNARALITLDGKPENMTLLTRRYSISPYKIDFYPPTYIPNGKNKVPIRAEAMYGLKKGNYFVTITIPLIGGETVSLKKALTIE